MKYRHEKFDLAKMINEQRKENGEKEIDFSTLSIDAEEFAREAKRQERVDQVAVAIVDQIAGTR